MARYLERTVLSLAIVGCALLAAEPPSESSVSSDRLVPRCDHVGLTKHPGWVVSAAWTADGNELLVVDNLSRQILRYTTGGRFRGTIPKSIGAALEQLSPSIIKQRGNELILELARGRFIVLDQRYVPRDSSQIVQEEQDGIQSVFLWSPAGHDLVTFSDVRINQQWHWAFLRFPFASPKDFMELFQVAHEDTGFYRLGYPYITALGSTAYFLIVGKESIELMRTTGAGVAQRLPLPGLRLGVRPRLPRFLVREDIAPLMKAVEASSMPAGIYGWEGFIYLLSREPSNDGTRWSLTKIDPIRGTFLGSAVLPTDANHLAVAPGPRYWAFLEKGPVIAFGDQKLNRVLLIASDKLRQPSLQGALCD
jgi:hypothetical protein